MSNTITTSSAAFLIVYGADPSDRLAAYVFEDYKQAREASLPKNGLIPGVPPGATAGGHAYVIEKEADVTLNGALLVQVYNGLTGQAVKKFSDRATGVKRLLKELPNVAQPMETKVESVIDQPAADQPATDQPATKRGRRSAGPMTLAQQQAAYNELVREAETYGIKAKIHTSTFETYAKGEVQMNKLRDKIEAAKRAPASTTEQQPA